MSDTQVAQDSPTGPTPPVYEPTPIKSPKIGAPIPTTDAVPPQGPAAPAAPKPPEHVPSAPNPQPQADVAAARKPLPAPEMKDAGIVPHLPTVAHDPVPVAAILPAVAAAAAPAPVIITEETAQQAETAIATYLGNLLPAEQRAELRISLKNDANKDGKSVDELFCFHGPLVGPNYGMLNHQIRTALESHPVIAKFIAQGHPLKDVRAVEDGNTMLHFILPKLSDAQYKEFLTALATPAVTTALPESQIPAAAVITSVVPKLDEALDVAGVVPPTPQPPKIPPAPVVTVPGDVQGKLLEATPQISLPGVA